MLKFRIVFSLVFGRIGIWRQMNEDMQQMSKGYETARTKGSFKTMRQTKQIYVL